MGGELGVADSSTVGGEIVVRNDSLMWWEEIEIGGRDLHYPFYIVDCFAVADEVERYQHRMGMGDGDGWGVCGGDDFFKSVDVH
jgi:hypothetical protein